MTPDQIPQLIKQISYADPRILPVEEDELIAMAGLWAIVLAEVDYAFALNAAGQHYANSPFTVRPSDIAEQWRTRTHDLSGRHVDPLPAADPDDPWAYNAELRATRKAAAGNVVPFQSPRRALGPGGTERAVLAYEPEDLGAMRLEGDLKRMWAGVGPRAKDENARRKALVLKHEDLAKKLTEPPIGLARADCWTGFVPQEHNGAGLNRSPIRIALAQLVTAAELREAS